MTNKTQHTEGNWVAQGQKNLASGSYEWVIKVKQDEISDRVIATTPYTKKYNDHEANAKFICQACNNYEALVKALGAAFRNAMREDCWHGEMTYQEVFDVLSQAEKDGE